MKKSKSGLKFTRVGVKQKIVVGSLLRSEGYGSRIVRVLGFWTGPSSWRRRYSVNLSRPNPSCEYLVGRTRC